jgi:hypothetical protein
MHVSFALLADGANISQEGKLNILGVFDAVQVASLPTVHPRAHLVVRLKGRRADAGAHTLALRWVNPAGEVLWSTSGQLGVEEPPQSVADMDLPLIAAIDLPLDRAGAYAMHVSLDGEDQARVPLQVRLGTAGPLPAPGVAGGMVS